MKFFALFLGSWLVGSGCASSSQKTEPALSPPDVRLELLRIKDQAAKAPWETTANRLRTLAQNHPSSEVGMEAQLELAQLLFSERRYNDAHAAYMRVVNARQTTVHEPKAIVGATLCLQKLGRPDEALGLSDRYLQLSTTAGTELTEIRVLRRELFSQLGQRAESVKETLWLADNAEPPHLRVQFRQAVLTSVEGVTQPDALRELYRNHPWPEVRLQAATRLGRLHYEQGDLSEARTWLERGQALVVQNKPEHREYQQQIQYYLDQIEVRRRVRADTVGLVIPLSGRYSAVGQKTLRGVQLALGLFSGDASPLRLAVIDSEASAEVARRAVERLVQEDNAIAIIGGLTSKTALAEARKAQELGVPFVALSQVGGVTDVGEFVFRGAISTQSLAQAVLQHAVEKEGVKRLAILYPRDNYGQELAQIMFQLALNRGLSIRALNSYDPRETDFKDSVRRMVGLAFPEDRADEYRLHLKDWQEKNPKKSKQPPEDLLPPVVDFDAIFIPDGTKAVGQIAPTLLYFGVKNVRVLGTNLLNSADLVRRGQKSVEGALFVDALMEGDESFKMSPFGLEFSTVFEEPPGLFELLGYDAAVVIRKALAQGQTSRVGVKDSMTAARNLPGGFGEISVSPEREVQRPLKVLTVQSGLIREALATSSR